MYTYPNVVTIMSLTWLIGMAISVLYTVPLILLAKYHQSNSYVRKVSTFLYSLLSQILTRDDISNAAWADSKETLKGTTDSCFED